MPTVVPTCPEGMAFEIDPIYDCMSCDLCVEFPNTGICSTQKCIDFLGQSVTDALQLAAREGMTGTEPPAGQPAVWVWVVVACLTLLLVAVGAVVTAIILRKKKRQNEVILGNREKKGNVQPVPLPDMIVEKLNFPVENTEPPSLESLGDLQQALTSLDNVALSELEGDN
ncbi:PREDICTED: uncharacterized protein LOC109465950 [Branchiostoma belcheri]|uniref:Uncharacterized protein LOC109465950 n=1 Tax=Branchiostoma belcheri TaxID=7741 RepID=A0A6P4YJY0_BRABE|nr:PREDICTED: uncharacterized protein LOC109465950 [Branchiostoma belcheri]